MQEVVTQYQLSLSQVERSAVAFSVGVYLSRPGSFSPDITETSGRLLRLVGGERSEVAIGARDLHVLLLSLDTAAEVVTRHPLFGSSGVRELAERLRRSTNGATGSRGHGGLER